MADRFWVGGAGDWNNTVHWSTTSGGSSGASVPATTDDVFIDSNSGLVNADVISLSSGFAHVHNLTCTSGVAFVLDRGAGTQGIDIHGSMTLEAGITFTPDWCDFYSTGVTETITTAGVIIGVEFTDFYGTAEWILQDDYNCGATQFYQENGTFNANGHNVSCDVFFFKGDTGFTPTVTMGSGIWEVKKNDVVYSALAWTYGGAIISNVTITPGTSTIKFSDATGRRKTFDGQGKTYNNMLFTGSGTGELVILGSNTFNNFQVDTPPHTIMFDQSQTNTVSLFTVRGTSGNLITINSFGHGGTIDSSLVNTNNANSLYGASLTGIGQSFTGDGGVLGSTIFNGFQTGSPTGNVVSKIYAHSGTFGTSSVPTGAALATSDVIDAANFVSGYNQFNFTGANQITLVNGTHYVVTIEYSGGDASNHLTILYNSGSVHAGNLSVFSGSWTAQATNDLDFGVFNTTVPQHTLTKAAAGIISSDYLDISNSSATGGLWYAGFNSNNTLNNSGWIFRGAAVVVNGRMPLMGIG